MRSCPACGRSYLAYREMATPVPPLRVLRPELEHPASLQSLLDTLLAKERAGRPGSAEEVHQRLRELVSQAGREDQPPGPPSATPHSLLGALTTPPWPEPSASTLLLPSGTGSRTVNLSLTDP